MKIINAMFSRVNGGVEQVFLNYTTALEQMGNQVIPVIHPWADIRKECLNDNLKTVFSFGRNDFIAARRLKQLIESEKPDCIISQTKRAAFLINKTNTKVPKIAVCHTIQSFGELQSASDAIIAITEQMHQEIKKSGLSTKNVYSVPNMIYLPKELRYREPKERDVSVIGASGRLSVHKGIDVFIGALAELKSRNIAFKAKIAGDGKLKKKYLKLIHQYGLQNEITLLGWVRDKHAFYESLDIFCHPSLHESFGLVVVESMMHSLPMVLTQTPGPQEIIADTESALFVPPSDPIGLANGLECVIRDHALAKKLAFNGFQRAQHYSIKNVGPILQKVLDELCDLQ